MESNYKEVIENAYNYTRGKKDLGEIATYTPELAYVNPAKFGIHMTKVNGTHFGIGDHLETFSIQSIAKVLSLALSVKFLGERIWTRVDVGA